MIRSREKHIEVRLSWSTDVSTVASCWSAEGSARPRPVTSRLGGWAAAEVIAVLSFHWLFAFLYICTVTSSSFIVLG